MTPEGLQPMCRNAMYPTHADAGSGLWHGAVLRAGGGGVCAHRLGGHELGGGSGLAFRTRQCITLHSLYSLGCDIRATLDAVPAYAR